MDTGVCCTGKEETLPSATRDGCGSGDTVKERRNFSILVEEVSGNCRAGEEWSERAIADRKIPVLSCEGPCVKGEIARRAAGMLPLQDPRFKRACHGEAFYVPHSSMAKWVRESDRVVLIDGCFLACHGRVLAHLTGEEKILHINAHAIHKKHADDFSFETIPEQELAQLAQQVSRAAIAMLSAAGS